MASIQSDPDEAAWAGPIPASEDAGRREPITELVNGTFAMLWTAAIPAPHLRLVFSEESPQSALLRRISKLCKALWRDAVNDD
jgi:hypothetical protein